MQRGNGTPFLAAADIEGYRIVTLHANDNSVVKAANGNAALRGVTQVEDVVAGKPVAVHAFGVNKVRAGAAFAKGSPLTADASGKAVLANPGAGVKVFIIGYAEQAATAADDLVDYLGLPQRITG